MSRHATAEVLSAYLDDELSREEGRWLDDHLEACESCRAHLASMRRVVSTLRRVERTAPPPVLTQYVQRRIALAGRPASRLERLEERLRAVPQASSIFFTFALVTALAVLVYFFAHSVDRSQRPRTALVVATAPQPEIAPGEVRPAAGRTFQWNDGVWREVGLDQRVADFHVEADSPAGREILSLFPDLAELPGRVLLRLDDSVVDLRGVGK